jgi:hypothetical protein
VGLQAAERRVGPEGREGDEEEGRGGGVAEHKEREAERSPEGDEKEADSGDEDDDDEEEEDEVPEDLRALPWPQQQLRIKVRSAAMMLGGTALVLLFADPMVGVLSELGKRINVGSFYVSFVLSPLVSARPRHPLPLPHLNWLYVPRTVLELLRRHVHRPRTRRSCWPATTTQRRRARGPSTSRSRP